VKRFLIFIALCAVAGIIYSQRSWSADSKNAIEKEKMIWLDANGNFQRFGAKADIIHYLDKIKETGFNKIVVDVRPVTGYALYKSNILPPLTKVGDVTISRDWDYLQFFIDEARKRGMKVAVSVTVFTGGSPIRGTGNCV
jgi:uncharacterized lipoprotein YddW (UPF0748 family)